MHHADLARFDEFQRNFPGPINSCIQIKMGAGAHLVVGCMVHGDEVGCLPPLLQVVHDLTRGKLPFDGTFTVFIGNRAAAELGRRFIEQDLNRVFLPSAPDSSEKTRALELMPLLTTADLFIDLHQTIQATDRAFYTFAFSEGLYQWAKYLEGADTLVTRAGDVQFASDALSATEWAVDRGVPALTLESGQRGYSAEAYGRDLRVIMRAIAGLGKIGRATCDVSALTELAAPSKELLLLKRVMGQSFSHPKMGLRAGLMNFSRVAAGEIIGSRDGNADLKVVAGGYILFPKYPERDADGAAVKPWPSDLFVLQTEAELAEFRR